MAEVWEARHVHLGSRAAIKFLLPRLAGDPELEDRFLNEGKRQARLQHENIVAAIDFLQLDGRSYLVMQYVEGKNLETKLKEQNGPLSFEEVRTISSAVLSALDYAHSLGVVHRDVKPSNILLGKNGRALLSDFGIALALGEEKRMTRVGTAVGTPDYMSPEQITRPKAVDARTDIYSFGCVLYAMLTGRPPFGGDDATEFYIQDCHVRAAPPPLVTRNRAISPALERVVMQCLEKDPANRFQSCGAVKSALDVMARPEEDKTGDGPTIQRQIGQYLLEEKLGEGGMAEVWKARHQVLGTHVAVKFLSARLAGIPDIEQRFLGEGKRQAALQHANIVSAYDFLYINERSYLIMKFIEGQSLDDVLFRRQAPLPIPQALAISADVLHALGYAHSQNVVHRDIKPSNILVENGGRAFVIDFGIALMLGQERATRVGLAVGTPHFMSPEQIMGSRDIDRRSDIYSFGCVLYQMLTQKLPFDAQPGDGDTEYVIKDKHLRQRPEPLRQWNAEIPEPFERAVLRCLEKKAADRFGSCDEVLAALTQAPAARTPTTRTPTRLEIPTGRPVAAPLPSRPPVTAKTVVLPPPEPEPPAARKTVVPPAPAPVRPAASKTTVTPLPPTVESAPPTAVTVTTSPSMAQSPPRGGLSPTLIAVGVIFALVLAGVGFYMHSRQQEEVASAPNAVAQPSSGRTDVTASSVQLSQTAAPGGQSKENPKKQVSASAPEHPSVVEEAEKPAQTETAPALAPAPTHVKPVPKASVAPAAEMKDLSGNWRGEYTHSDQIKKVNLHISEDSADVLTGTLTFDAGGNNPSSCSLSGNYNPETKFMLLVIDACQGSPPNYLQGKVGFSPVNPSDRRVMGVDHMHDGLLSISR